MDLDSVPIVTVRLHMVAVHFAVLQVLETLLGTVADDLVKQFDDIKGKMHSKWKDGKYMAYFQAFTNTHAPVEVLPEKYETVLNLAG